MVSQEQEWYDISITKKIKAKAKKVYVKLCEHVSLTAISRWFVGNNHHNEKSSRTFNNKNLSNKISYMKGKETRNMGQQWHIFCHNYI